ncbi:MULTISPECIES: hypothetical protein [Hydrogenophaga]|nr:MULTISPECIES: hypothetical protein [Hydrogenophaga]
MNRCPTPSRHAPRLAGLLVAAALAALATSASAQAVRDFPANAWRGTLVVTQPPAITIDGQAARLSPGARIKGPNNTLLLSSTLVNQELTVNYTVEAHGLVHEVWVLTDAEAAEKRARAGE